MKLIIQIPCYNEEKTLAVTYADLPKQINGIDEIEYLIINDGSSDRTVEVARELGFHHIVSFKQNKGLAKGFMAGIDACLHLGADIVVNTDADNQYCGADIEKLVRPILEEKADIVIGERPIDETEHFSWKKKKFQYIGSLVVRLASGTKVPDAPSGFRAYSREAALRLNVVNEYTYTLETIIQAGHNKIAMTSVPIRTNPETRESRLFKNMWAYMRRSSSVIIRSFMMYKPLKFFGTCGTIIFLLGVALGVRYLFYLIGGTGEGHIQSLILSAILILMGVQTFIVGLQADIIAANRKILEDVQYRVRKMECSKEKNLFYSK
ncbi:Glycosyltransferase [Desulfosporosinus sp. I2]|uniref:glycosyltransferase family 2 protein n=1 Tax=Desulfosporosinus sp. I2 TaxID=1617025 RepID=UPI0005F03E7E|nr:glycosyltransferase family 2 protein [Desulfosporosinus sp. I2]KJR46151.1 Glycosyltransferase [Desulfosporosinus sp. I2]